LGILFSSILCTCPNQHNLFNVAHWLIFLFTLSACLYGVSIYWSILAFMLCRFSNPCSCAAFWIFLGKLSLPANGGYIAERHWFQCNDSLPKLALRELFLNVICPSSFNLVFISRLSYFFVAATWFLLKCEGWCFPRHRRNIFSIWTPQPLKRKAVGTINRATLCHMPEFRSHYVYCSRN
jgi:hypothetical protein